MIGCQSAIDWRLIGALFMALFFFGIAFNFLVHYLAHRKEGYTAFLVVIGVIVTLAALAVIDWKCALLTGAFFTASGTPMIIGDMYRSIKRREEALKALQRLDEHG